MIVGIAAKKQCGKDSMAGFIKELLPDKKVKQISFAKHLKDFIHEAFDIPKAHLYGTDDQKNYPMMTWGEMFTGMCMKRYRKTDRTLLSAREILQVVGTDVFRQGNLNFLHGPNESKVRHFLDKKFGRGTQPFDSIWIDLAIMDIKVLKARNELDVAVVSDVRFHNERKAISEAGGINVRLYRDTGCDDTIPHPSELELDEMNDQDFDFVLTEEGNKNLPGLKRWTTNMLMQAGLIEVGGISV